MGFFTKKYPGDEVAEISETSTYTSPHYTIPPGSLGAAEPEAPFYPYNTVLDYPPTDIAPISDNAWQPIVEYNTGSCCMANKISVTNITEADIKNDHKLLTYLLFGGLALLVLFIIAKSM